MLCASFLSLDWRFVLVNANRKLTLKKMKCLGLISESVFSPLNIHLESGYKIRVMKNCYRF